MITKDELDQIANTYHSNDILNDKFIEDECQFYTYNWVFKHIKENSKILELGYGEGNFTQELINRNFNPTIIDGSKILLDKAKSKFGNKVTVINELFENYRDHILYDVIIATHVLEHVDNPVILLENLKNLLKEKGIIIIVVPNANSIHRKLSVIMNLQPKLDSLSPRDVLVGHQRVYTFKTLEDDVINSGLKIIDKSGFFLKVLPNSMMTSFDINLIKALNTISPEIDTNILANIGMIVSK